MGAWESKASWELQPEKSERDGDIIEEDSDIREKGNDIRKRDCDITEEQ